MLTLQTDRLILRPWRDADRAAFAALNADPEVMAHFPAPLDRRESDTLIYRQAERWSTDGLCLHAVERRIDSRFLGMAGLAKVGFEAAFTPAVEIGWRFARFAWGHGYASEAAAAWLGWGFRVRALEDIVSFTTLTNQRSAAVMARIGMRRDPKGDFDHPGIGPGHRLRRHQLYRLSRAEWVQASADQPD